MKVRRLLLVNPWIADFAAFDLWAKPVGLLSVAKYLMRFGYEEELVDLMDRSRWQDSEEERFRDGRGKYRKTFIPKPAIVSHIPRRYGLYGATREQFSKALSRIKPPDAILVTSLIAYWYPGVKATVDVLRSYFPSIPLILGGIYASLYPNHAREVIRPDHLITGYGEKKTLMLMDVINSISRNYDAIPEFDDSGELPWFLYPRIDSTAILTSRGCPNRCSYCATRLLHPRFVQRRPDEVIREIMNVSWRYNVRDFAFYDDALFINRDRHIIPILKGVISSGIRVRFHCPNGLFAREINQELANLMKEAGFHTIRLSLESVAPEIQLASTNKVDDVTFIKTMQYLENAGFQRCDIEVYLIIGLPDQTERQVLGSIQFVADQGAIIRLASFSPIPGTVEWERAKARGYVFDNMDPLLTNKTVFPFNTDNIGYDEYQKLLQFANEANSRNRRQFKSIRLGE